MLSRATLKVKNLKFNSNINYRFMCTNTKTPTNSNEYFGYQSVEKGERQQMVNKLFNKVSAYYDTMNDVMSFGVHRVWKNRFVNDVVDPQFGQKILDLAGGTGDIAFRIVDRLALKILNDPKITQDMYKETLSKSRQQFPIVTVCDLSEKMIEYGRWRMEELKLGDSGIDWVVSNAEKMPFPDNTFDTITISFGLRNMSNIPTVIVRVVKELNRVLKPNGRLLILEFSHPTNMAVSSFYKLYSNNIIPLMGKVVADDRNSYKYLVESIQMFYKQDELCRLLQANNYHNVVYQNWANGIVAVHEATKPLV